MTLCGGLPRLVWRMPWLLHYLVILLPLSMSMVSFVDSGRKLPSIYWNSSNTLFRRPDSLINIQLNDNIDIICPDYSHSQDPPSTWEYYSIYLVTKEEYDNCTIIDPRSHNVTKLLNCSSPGKPNVFTLLVFSFQPIPNMPDFRTGRRYYMISTSTGTPRGIDNQINGSCRARNMRLILDLSDKPVTASPSPHTGSTVSTQHTTPRPTPSPTSRSTTKKTTTTHTTTRRPTTTTRRPTSKFPDGTPVDPSIVIDAPGGDKNTGIISAGVESVRCSVTTIVLLTLVTLLLLVR